jgi:predicted dienelactone hydrolase
MTVAEVLIVLSAAVAGVSGLLAAAVRRHVCAFASGCAVVVGVLVAVVDRLRFPLAGVAVGLLVAALAAFTLHHRVGRVLAVSGSVFLTAVAALGLWALPRVTTPETTGPAQVGTARFEWTDESRGEPATSNPNDRRTVVVQAWYPADPRPKDPRALYLGRTSTEARQTADGIAATYGVPSLLLHEAAVARTRAYLDAPPQRNGQRWPIVLFSPGLAGYRAQNTSWAQEIASHGYFVVAVDHPYESAAVVLDDDSVIATNVRTSGDRDADNRVTDHLTDVRAQDLSFVLDQIDAIEGSALRSPFAGLLDTRSIAAVGHSVGGAAAIQVAQQDPRVDAIINLDGLPRNVVPQRFPQPILAVVAGRGTGNEQSDATYRRTLNDLLRNSDGGGLCLTVDGASHLSFTDAPMILPPLPSLIGSGGRRHGHDITSRATLIFLDAALRGNSGDITGPLSDLGDLHLVCEI